MRILHVVPSYIPAYRYGGPIYSVHGLCKALVGLGHDVNVFTTNVDGEKDSDVPLECPVDIDGVKVWYFPSTYLRRLYYSSSMGKALKRELKNFDLIHLHSIFLWPTWAAARAARRMGVPYVVSPRGMLVKDLIARKSKLVKSAWLTFIEKMNLERASAIHVTSLVEEQEAHKFGFRFPPFFMIRNGIDDDFLTDQANVSSELTEKLLQKGSYIFFLGRINWKKGLDRLILALPLVPNVRLVIAGNDEEGYRNKLESSALGIGVADRITYTGPVYGTEKRVLMERAAIFVLPSYSENFGNAVLEAMAVGCPVVVTPEVGAAEIVARTGAGLVLDGKPEVFGRGMNELLLNSQLMKEIGDRGKQAVRGGFTWSVIAGKMEDVYREIIRRKR